MRRSESFRDDLRMRGPRHLTRISPLEEPRTYEIPRERAVESGHEYPPDSGIVRGQRCFSESCRGLPPSLACEYRMQGATGSYLLGLALAIGY